MDVGGAPVAGLLVETVESTVRTDEDGRFGLHYKPPDTHVHFVHEEAWYRRQYLPEDDGTVVEIALPATRSLDVDCGAYTCALQLQWDLGPGYTAKRTGRCEAGKTTTLPGSPPGQPTVSCREKVTEPELEHSARMTGDLLELRPPLRDVTVTLQSDGSPAACQVYVDGDQLASRDDGSFTGSAAGEAVVQAVCDGRAAIPAVLAGDATALELPWTAEGPMLRPPPGMELDRLTLQQSGGWTLVHRAEPSGGFALPPLPAGDYAVLLYTNEPSAAPPGKPSDLKPGVVVGQLLPTGQYAAHLTLERDMGDGVLEATLTGE
ncbi:MAG: hypothetical protein H6737_03375 [Alphaproteobacteria bacterium]|nr:hypothetical protein [Alphaproteobacteria bacterium]